MVLELVLGLELLLPFVLLLFIIITVAGDDTTA